MSPRDTPEKIDLPLHIAIIGGGLGGLGAAISLQRAGFHVTVFERDAWFADRKQGYGLTLINNPKGPLAHLGLLDECIRRDCPSTCHYVFKPCGEVLGYYGKALRGLGQAKRVKTVTGAPAMVLSSDRDQVQGQEGGDHPDVDLGVKRVGDVGGVATPGLDDAHGKVAPSSSGGEEDRDRGTAAPSAASIDPPVGPTAIRACRGNLRVPRQDLRQMLLDCLKPGTVRWGCRLLGYEERNHEEGVSITFEVQLDNSHSAVPPTSSSTTCPSPLASTNPASTTRTEVVRADVLIGADGLRSAVRRLRDELLLTKEASRKASRQLPARIPLQVHPNVQQCQRDDGLHLVGPDSREPKAGAVSGAEMGATATVTPLPPLLPPSVPHTVSPLRYIGVTVILGLTTAEHPLIHQRGFYIVDGRHRLFTMPFREASESAEPFEEGDQGTRDVLPVIASPSGTLLDTARGKGSVVERDPAEAGGPPCCSAGARGPQRPTLDMTAKDDVMGTALRPDDLMMTHGRRPRRPPLTMWQLSFSGVTEQEGLHLRSSPPASILQEALRRVEGWMEPVPMMVRMTPATEVWATPLYDRDPMYVFSKRSGGGGVGSSGGVGVGSGNLPPPAVSPADSHVTLIGDACHPMSMFKGQGANQALEDGPLLSSWLSKPGLSRANLATRLRCFERNMVARSSAALKGSRDAADRLHSGAVFHEDFGIEGLRGPGEADQLLKALKEAGVGAASVEDLDERIREVAIGLSH